MKKKVLIFSLLIISIVLIIQGCSTKSENFALSSDGVKISFDNQGEGQPALVFVHGWANNRSVWDVQITHFSEKYKVINVDLPGFGESGNNRQTWTMVSFGNDIAAVIKKLNLDQVVLVGFSMGVPVVIETANILPDNVAGVVLVDFLQDVDMKYSPEDFTYIDSVYMDMITNPTIEKLKYLFRRNIEESFERILSMLNGAPREGWRESIHDMMRWSNEESIESIKSVRAPIISINSDQTPTNVEAFKMYAPSFKVKIIPDVGHLVMWDAPEEFNRLLEESIQEF